MRLLARFISQTWAIWLLLAAWQIWVMTTNYNSIVVVSPFAVAHELVSYPAVFLVPALWTLAIAIAGLALGLTAGILLAAAAWRSPFLRSLSMPMILVLTTTPVVCIIPVLARIFGYERRSELIAVMIMTFFPSFIYATVGLRHLPHRTGEYFRTQHATRWQQFFSLALPAAMPDIAIALRIGASYSILVTVVAEFLMQVGGLGMLFALMMQEFNLRRALGASVIAILLSVALYRASIWVEGKLLAHFR